MNRNSLVVLFLTVCILIQFFAMPSAESAQDVSSSAKLVKVHLKTGGVRLHVAEKIQLHALGEYSDNSQRDITQSVNWMSKQESVARFVGRGILMGESIGQVGIYVTTGKLTSDVEQIRVYPPIGPVLEVKTPRIDLGNVEKNSIQKFTVSIRNSGMNDLEWNVVTDQPWLVPGKVESDEAYRDMLKKVNKDTLTSVGTGKFGLLAQSIEKPKPSDGSIRELSQSDQFLSEKRNRDLQFTAYTAGLPEGEYSGSITIISNGGTKKVDVFMKIVSLQSIQISPVSIKVRIGQKRSFKAIGIWSDGSRTDLSGYDQGQWVVSDHTIGSFLYKRPIFIAKKIGHVEITKVRGNVTSSPASVDVEEFITEPVLFISPREIDFGAIGPGEQSDGVVSLANVGSKSLVWSVTGPEGWGFDEQAPIYGTIERSPHYLRCTIMSSTPGDESPETLKKYPVILKIETMNNTYRFKNTLLPGRYRLPFIVISNGGQRHVFLKFNIAEEGAKPHLSLDPQGIDLGSIQKGKRLVRKIQVTNKGKDVLSWKAELQRNRKYFSGMNLKRGRYFSLYNEKRVNKEKYEVPEHLRDSVYISGSWFEDNGYPSTNSQYSSLKTTFFGTGLVLFVWQDPDGGIVNVFVDDEPVGTVNCRAEERSRVEVSLVENLEEGPHIVTLICGQGNVMIEGMRIYGEELMRGKDGWIRIYPDLGTTAKETDYVNIMITTDRLSPGKYTENILFSSNGGNDVVEIAAEISEHTPSQLIKVYRFTKGTDYLYTTDPGSETLLLPSAYKNEGAVFSLFRKGTHGTTEFYRWHSPSKNDHFYSYDRNGGGKSLKGYEFEESIGNIATSRLTDTRELYRWYNPDKGTHFYSTDLKGEELTEKGYKYDGIAGYVR